MPDGKCLTRSKCRPWTSPCGCPTPIPPSVMIVTGTYDSYEIKHPPLEPLVWTTQPENLTNKMSMPGCLPPRSPKPTLMPGLNRTGRKCESSRRTPTWIKPNNNLTKRNKMGIDPRTLLPGVEVGEAVWSPDQSAYLVQCRMAGTVKKWNLAVRNDNAANRYVFDGGL